MLLPVALALLSPDWTLKTERTGFRETGRYEEAVAFSKRLAAASSDVKFIKFGVSPEGRDMVAILLQRGDTKGKPLVFVNNGIHSGEIEGKDASLMLARDIVVAGKYRSLLDKVRLLIVPIYSVDAHERFSAYNRINQNGPQEMGWRTTSTNLNLNRDYMKADAPETRAELSLMRKYPPDFFFDDHTTDGADYQYVLTLGVPWGPTLPSGTAAWQHSMYSAVKARCDADGFLTSPYFEMADSTNPAKGLSVDDYSPRYSNGYLTALGRPSMLVETHVLKPYKDRVLATYSVLLHTIEYIGANAKALTALNRTADSPSVGKVTLTCKQSPQRNPFTFFGWRSAPTYSTAAGAKVHHWDHVPVTTETTIADEFLPDLQVTPPAAYAIPRQWVDVIDRLRWHGIKTYRSTKALTGELSTWRLDGVKFPTEPFEGRFMPGFRAVPIVEHRLLLPGTVIVPTDQVRRVLAMQLLEPDAPDSLVRWGVFNSVFERKEYGEDYATAPVADKMLAENPGLKAEFDEKLKDPRFAASPGARLDFFYQRSLWADSRLGRYPVVCLTSEQLRHIR